MYKRQPIDQLPVNVLPFLMNSRYCEVDLLSSTAAELFWNAPRGWQRVQAVCSWVHSKVTFGYEFSSPFRTCLLYTSNSPPYSGSINLDIEHDRGPFNGMAEITGTVTDPTGAVVSNASVGVHEVPTGKLRSARTNATGQFSLPGLPSGDYKVQVTAPGFKSIAREFKVHARDRAVVTVVLTVGAASTTVEVTGQAVVVEACLLYTSRCV